MSFKYINPGYPKLFGSDGNYTVNNTLNPINGIIPNSPIQCAVIPFPDECDEIWIKAGFVYRAYNDKAEIGIGGYTSRGATSSRSDNNEKFYGFHAGGNTPYALNGLSYIQLTNFGLMTTNKYYTITIHSKNGTDGCLVVYIDGMIVYNYVGEVSWYSHSVALRNGNCNMTLCNVIISDTEITKSEQVYLLTPLETDTSMSENNGIYTATEVNQTIKQSVDVSALTSKIGTSNIKITGVCVGSIESVVEGEGLTHLVSLQNDTEKGQDHLIPYNNAAGVSTSWSEDLTATELSALKFGWKAKE